MRFEKWQALGNDYLIVERDKLPFVLSPARVRLLCDPHFGVGADGVLELCPPVETGTVAHLKIHNPDGSEAELSGNGAREAIMYLFHRGWTDQKQFSITTASGEIRPTILSDTECKADMGRAFLSSDDFPSGGPDGTGELRAGDRSWSFQHVKIGNPQCSIRVGSISELEELDLPEIGPAIENHELFPQRTNVSWWTEIAPGKIRARIFERGVGETASSGTGSSGAAVSYVLQGGDSPTTVVLDGGELTVEVGEDLGVDLSGWAIPTITAEVSPEFLSALQEAE